MAVAATKVTKPRLIKARVMRHLPRDCERRRRAAQPLMSAARRGRRVSSRESPLAPVGPMLTHDPRRRCGSQYPRGGSSTRRRGGELKKKVMSGLVLFRRHRKASGLHCEHLGGHYELPRFPGHGREQAWHAASTLAFASDGERHSVRDGLGRASFRLPDPSARAGLPSGGPPEGRPKAAQGSSCAMPGIDTAPGPGSPPLVSVVES